MEAQREAQDGQELFETRTSRQFQNMSAETSVKTFTDQWEVVNGLVKHLLGQVQQQKIPQQQIYPLVPHTIVSIACGVYGFTPRGGLIETELLSKAETLIGSTVARQQFAYS